MSYSVLLGGEEMEKFECYCGGKLIKNGKLYKCESCGSEYILSQDEEGSPILYKPIEKKEIEFAQISEKASEIKTEKIEVKQFRLDEDIHEKILKESLNVSIKENIGTIKTYISHKEWEKAQEIINNVLTEDYTNSEAQWALWMCENHLANEESLIKSFSHFNEADKKRLDTILSNSTPDFAKKLIDLLFANSYLNDSMCHAIMTVILPYAKIESVYSNSDFKYKTDAALLEVIDRQFAKSFDYLLHASLDANEVDKYIDYLDRFGDKCNPVESQRYYSDILAVDPGNLVVHRKLVNADIKANVCPDKSIKDLEELLKYSDKVDSEIETIFALILSQGTTTKNISTFVWNLIGYHSAAPEGLKVQLLTFAKILLQSELWKEANDYLQLVLSFDARNADAYWMLCMYRLQAKTEKDIRNKKDNLIDCAEFNKALALYQSGGNEKRVKALMAYTQKQKATKKGMKVLIVTGIVVALLFAGYMVFNTLRYSDDVNVGFKETSYSDGWSAGSLQMLFENKAWVDINTLYGVMSFYNENDEKIAETQLEVRNLPSGQEQTVNITLDHSTANDLISSHFESVKVTYTITGIVYSDGRYKEFENGEEVVIKDITKSSAEIDLEIEQKLKEQYDVAMAAIDAVDEKSENFNKEITDAVANLDDIWDDVVNSKSLLEDMYNKASQYEKNKDFLKAYLLFSLIGRYNYEDSSSRADACYEKAYESESDF